MTKHIPNAIVSNSLLSGLTDTEKNLVFKKMEKVPFNKGDIIFNVGEEGEDIFFIQSGEVEIYYPMTDGKDECHFGVLRTGMSFGERSLLKDKIRTASVRSLTETVIYRLKTEFLKQEDPTTAKYITKIYENLASHFSQLLGENNSAIVFALERDLKAAQLQSAMGSFIVSLIIGLCLFVFISGSLNQFVKLTGAAPLLSVGMLIVTLGCFYWLARSHNFPKSTYGFTLEDWKKSIIEGIFYSLIFVFICTILKYIVITNVQKYSHLSLIDPGTASRFVSNRSHKALKIFAMAFAYIFISSPLQEFLIRGGLQGSLKVFLSGRYKNVQALLAANMVFALMHLYLSVKLALGAFVIGLFWGWLFSRHKSILGTVFSHMFIGTYLFFVLGIQDFFLR